ncbi:MAG: SPOR domain-containing protein [Betaproteobacteria bacterium]|nr:SPOR domain-containing protein [Betaproteobacteria bacterium]
MAKAGRTQSAPGARSGGGFLLGVFVGLIVGLAVALGIAFYLNKTPIPFTSKSKAPAAKDGDAAKTTPQIAGMPSGKAPSGEKPKFDFYNILPGGEEPVSENELKSAAKSQQPDAKSVYFLQAGAFQNPPDADNLKAKLAILGFESTVEPATLPDKGTWYRVRVGPYTRIEELNAARSQLASNGIDASLIKVKNPAAAKP